MREPGEDDVCSCSKLEGRYGRWGWRFNVAGEVVERCPAYAAALKRSGGTPKAGRDKRPKGGRS